MAPARGNVGPEDIAACGLAVKKLRSDPSLIETPELEFFKDFVVSLGWSGQPEGAKEASKPVAVAENDDEGGAPSAVPVAEDAKGSGVMDLSDDEAPKRSKPKENTFGADLEAELRKEHNTQISIDDDVDTEHLERETDAYPLLAESRELESCSGAMKKALTKIKQEAQTALEHGQLNKALEKYTKALRTGGASSEMLLTRAALLLKLRRPLAAVRDCSVALKIDSKSSKAYRLRGTCHRKLGHWRRSHRDLSQAEKLDDFDDSSAAAVHKFVARKLGLVQDPRTRQWTKQQTGGSQKATHPTKSYDGHTKGTRVQLTGLQARPDLNGWIGTVELFDSESSRYQVKLDGESQPHKFKAANLLTAHTGAANLEDPAIEKTQRLEQERICRKRVIDKRLKQDGIPDMDTSELVEAEMSGMACDEVLCRLVRKLDTDQALEILWEVQASHIQDKQVLLRNKVQQALGVDEEEEEAEDEPDPDALEEETVALPPLPDDLDEAEPPDEQAEEMIRKAKQAAAHALERGDTSAALSKYTEALVCGGGSALLLAKRADILLGQKRPVAAIRDCTAALEVNPDCGKAFRIRGMAHRRLGHWTQAHSDLAQGQTLDFDDATMAIQAFVAKRKQAQERREAASRRKGAKRARRG